MQDDRPLILSIEDDKDVRESILNYLADDGMHAIGAADGHQGLALFREHKPDVTLLDLRVPAVDGLEVLKTIRRESPDAAVIVISGKGGMEDVIQALRLGASDYLMKPLRTLERLRESIEQTLARTRLARARERHCEDLERRIEAKDVALREVLTNIQYERDRIGQQVQSNVERMILPVLRSVKMCVSRPQQRSLEQIEQGLSEIVSPFIDKVSRDVATLTPTELRVCGFIRRGLAVKEIAEIERLSPETVAAHRRSIRRKLGIANQKINLTSYLQSAFRESNTPNR